MKRVFVSLACCALIVLSAVSLAFCAADDKGGERPGKPGAREGKGPPPEGRPQGGPGGPGGPSDQDGKGPPRFQLGDLFPPQMEQALHLTPDQMKELEALKKEVREKLGKLLTDDQKKTVENFRPRGPGGPGGPGGGNAGNGQDGPGPRGPGRRPGGPGQGPPPRGERPEGPPPGGPKPE